MFYSNAKKSAIKSYEIEYAGLEADFENLEKHCTNFNNVKYSAKYVIKDVEFLINSISNTPKEFEKELATITAMKNQFSEEVDFAKNSKIENIAIGLAFGMIPAMAKMGIKKITPLLSGHLIGGKIVGLGVKTLGIAGGPIGWTASAVGTIVGATKNNKKTANKATVETIKLQQMRTEIKKSFRSITLIKSKIDSASNIVKKGCNELHHLSGCDYTTFDADDKIRLGTLVNETTALSKLLLEKPELEGVVYGG